MLGQIAVVGKAAKSAMVDGQLNVSKVLDAASEVDALLVLKKKKAPVKKNFLSNVCRLC